MRIVIAGGHGKIALRLERLLAERGDVPVGLIRNPDHADDVRAAGAEPVVVDLEDTTATRLTEKLMGADAVVFAAGAGPAAGRRARPRSTATPRCCWPTPRRWPVSAAT
jgi:nucleoside-diphosphate-sugar epimerase